MQENAERVVEELEGLSDCEPDMSLDAASSVTQLTEAEEAEIAAAEQATLGEFDSECADEFCHIPTGPPAKRVKIEKADVTVKTVSYTHLTLPTICSV